MKINIDRLKMGKRIAHARHIARLSQSELCIITGISKSTLSKYENGHKTMSLNTLFRFCSAVNIPSTFILGI